MKNLQQALGFTLCSSEDFENSELAGRIVRRLLATEPELTPTTFGVHEPAELSVGDGEAVAAFWRDIALGRQTNEPGVGSLLLENPGGVRYQVGWQKSTSPRFSFVGGDVPLVLARQPENLASFLRLVRDLARSIHAVYGEVRNMSFPGWDLPFDLFRRLPDVPWVTILGAPYIEMFGEERLASTPCHSVEFLDGTHVLLQAADSPFEEIPEPGRRAIRTHLGEEAFMSGGRWRYTHGRAPSFDVSHVTIAQ